MDGEVDKSASSHPGLLDAIEFQTAVLVRNLEMLRRRSDFYTEVDRAGYLLLRLLEVTGPCGIGTLASALGLDPSTTGRQVNAVRAAGFADKSPDGTDLRRSVVTITPAGIAAARAVRYRRLEGTKKMLAEWSEEDLGVLAATFTRYNEAISRRYMPTNTSDDAEPSRDRLQSDEV